MPATQAPSLWLKLLTEGVCTLPPYLLSQPSPRSRLCSNVSFTRLRTVTSPDPSTLVPLPCTAFCLIFLPHRPNHMSTCSVIISYGVAYCPLSARMSAPGGEGSVPNTEHSTQHVVGTHSTSNGTPLVSLFHREGSQGLDSNSGHS